MPEQPAPSSVASAHPALNHRRRAAEHLRQAAVHLDRAVEEHEQRAHATAGARATDGQRHIDEACAHLREANRLHDASEQAH